MNRGIFHYQKDVWDMITDEQKKKLRKDRAKAKAVKANICDKAEKVVRNVSAVYSVPHHPSSDSELTVERGMFELDLDGVEEMKPPACNSSKMVFHKSGDDDIDLLIHNKAEALLNKPSIPGLMMSTRMVKPSGNTMKWEECSLSPSIRRIPHHMSLMLTMTGKHMNVVSRNWKESK
jgi:hypothetical protein